MAASAIDGTGTALRLVVKLSGDRAGRMNPGTEI